MTIEIKSGFIICYLATFETRDMRLTLLTRGKSREYHVKFQVFLGKYSTRTFGDSYHLSGSLG